MNQSKPIIFLLSIFLISSFSFLGGCAKKYKTSVDFLNTENSDENWDFYRHNLASTGSSQNNSFNGKFDILWEFDLSDKLTGPMTIHKNELALPLSRRKISIYELENGDYRGRIKILGITQTGLIRSDSLGIFALAPPKSRVECINLLNGKRLWKTRLSDASGGSILIDNYLIMSSRDGSVVSIELTSGDIRWEYDFETRLSSPPVFDDGRVYQATDDGQLFALDFENGEKIYSLKLGAPIMGGISILENIYLADLEGSVYAIEKDAGQIIWESKTDGPIWSAPSVADSFVVVASGSGTLTALDSRTGEFVWENDLVNVIKAPTTIVNNFVVTATLAGELYAHSLIDGQQVAMRQLDGAVEYCAVSNGKKLIVSTQNGTVICFGEKK